MIPHRTDSLSRRRLLTLGGGALAAGTTSASALAWTQSASSQTSSSPGADGDDPTNPNVNTAPPGPPPTDTFQSILQTMGNVSHDVLSIEIPRADLMNVKGPRNITFTPSWELHHDWSVQTLSTGEAMVNGEMSLLASETNAVIDQLVKSGLVFQAFHQHFTEQSPQIWHIHMRGKGAAADLANALVAAIKATATPFPPASPPSNPTSPLDANRLGQILGGSARVMEDGVVTVNVPRKNPMMLGGVYVSPLLAIATHVRFKPLAGTSDGDGNNGPTTAAAAPDFGMTADEVQNVVKVMRSKGFDVDCLYNQETDEHPQLYWSHQLGIGDAYQLAQAIRAGFDQMNLMFTS